MLLSISLENYRCFKEKVTFSMIPNSSESKFRNIAKVQGSNEKEYKFLKTALIYGPNASGKSTIIRAILEITDYILEKPKVGDLIQLSTPFEFDVDSKNKSSNYEIEFLGPKNIKYIYSFSITINKVIREKLIYFPNNRKTKLFERLPFDPSQLIQKGKLGDSLANKEISVFPNQLILSKFGDDEPHEHLTKIYLYFKNYIIVNAVNQSNIEYIQKEITKKIADNRNLKEQVDKLIHFADTKIISTQILQEVKPELSGSKQNFDFNILAQHDVFKNGKKTATTSLSFKQESTGTQILFTLGGVILDTLQNGGILIIDELDTSLHPFLTKLIVMLFHSPKINPKQAQLIFSSHDVTLLDKDLVRRDQVWITEKNEKGISDLYSLQDFEGLREDTAFEKWYLSGKFGGLPKLKSIDSIFD